MDETVHVYTLLLFDEFKEDISDFVLHVRQRYQLAKTPFELLEAVHKNIKEMKANGA